MAAPNNAPTPAAEATPPGEQPTGPVAAAAMPDDTKPLDQPKMLNKQLGGMPATDAPMQPATPPPSFESVCEEIAKGVKKLVDAGMGATAAGELAARVYMGRVGSRY